MCKISKILFAFLACVVLCRSAEVGKRGHRNNRALFSARKMKLLYGIPDDEDVFFKIAYCNKIEGYSEHHYEIPEPPNRNKPPLAYISVHGHEDLSQNHMLNKREPKQNFEHHYRQSTLDKSNNKKDGINPQNSADQILFNHSGIDKVLGPPTHTDDKKTQYKRNADQIITNPYLSQKPNPKAVNNILNNQVDSQETEKTSFLENPELRANIEKLFGPQPSALGSNERIQTDTRKSTDKLEDDVDLQANIDKIFGPPTPTSKNQYESITDHEFANLDLHLFGLSALSNTDEQNTIDDHTPDDDIGEDYRFLSEKRLRGLYENATPKNNDKKSMPFPTEQTYPTNPIKFRHAKKHQLEETSSTRDNREQDRAILDFFGTPPTTDKHPDATNSHVNQINLDGDTSTQTKDTDDDNRFAASFILKKKNNKMKNGADERKNMFLLYCFIPLIIFIFLHFF